jgi:hypothetical protein
LKQDLALLDLISAAATAPEALRERAHALAQAHEVAPPAQVDRALASLTAPAAVFDWDRPTSLAERQRRDEADAELLKTANAKVKHWYNGVLPHDAWRGYEIARMAALVAALVAVLVSPIVFAVGSAFSSLDPMTGFATSLAGALGLLGGLPLLGWLRARWLNPRDAPWENVAQAAALGQQDRTVWAPEPAHWVPSPAQMEAWLAWPEVAAQARAWIASPCGLMLKDVQLLDAQVKRLVAEQAAAMAAEEDAREAQRQVELARALGFSA